MINMKNGMDELITRIKQELADRKLEIEHLNAVNQELCDELTQAKLRIKELENE